MIIYSNYYKSCNKPQDKYSVDYNKVSHHNNIVEFIAIWSNAFLHKQQWIWI